MYKNYLIGAGIVLFFILCCFISYHFGRNSKIDEGKVVRDTTILVKVDTFVIEKPVEKIRYKDKPIYTPIEQIDTVSIQDTVFIAMPSEKVLYEGEEYKAVVSGVQPKLEEITVYPKTVYETITEKQIVKKKWNFNATVGPGVFFNIRDKNVGYGVGVVVGFGYSF